MLHKQAANKRGPYAPASYSSTPIGRFSLPGPLSSATTSDVTRVLEKSTKSERKCVSVCVIVHTHYFVSSPYSSPV